MTTTTLARNLHFTGADQRAAARLLDAEGGHLDLAESPQLLPAGLARIVDQVIAAVAAGGNVTIGMLPEELTTTVAAEVLGISRPTLMKMITTGEIPAHKVGSHHRLRRDDVLAAKKAKLARQRAAFEELRRLEDELDQF